MSDTIEVTRKQLLEWSGAMNDGEQFCTHEGSAQRLVAAYEDIDELLDITEQPISPLQAEVMALQPAPFSSLLLGKTIVDANNKAIGYARGITILQQDEMHNMVCEALNEYWDKHKA